MIAIPATDLRDRACVQLVGGSYEAEKIRLEDPVQVARRWEEAGFTRLHVIDLDAATGRGTNSAVVSEIMHSSGLEVQVGGGVRDAERVEELVRDGARRVITGTRAIEDPDWLAELASDWPDRIIVAADVRGRRVATRGWGKLSDRHVLDVIGELNELPLAGVMVTAVHREGQMLGADLALVEDVVEECTHPVIASGGVATIGDLRALADRGAAAVVIGMALYTGALDPRTVAEEFCE